MTDKKTWFGWLIALGFLVLLSYTCHPDKNLKEVRVVEAPPPPPPVPETNARTRMAVGQELERRFLDKGWDVTVKTYGKNKTTIKLEFILFSRPMIYKLVNDTALWDELKNAGFKKLIFDDKEGNTWTYDLWKTS